MAKMMVLDDGETYSGLKGCTILEVAGRNSGITPTSKKTENGFP